MDERLLLELRAAIGAAERGCRYVRAAYGAPIGGRHAPL
jgi:hypothetical protein